MTGHRAALLGAAVVVGLSAAPSLADGSDDRTAYLAETCRGCHAAAGPSAAIPAIGRAEPDALAATLRDYRDGRRVHPAMAAAVAGLDDRTLAALAAYLASERPAP
ncbi:c-type cytochrome [Chthonobacter rhizosphaerae]|uniref:c-type cytochrome n=1 Tax=Chthonobacter rhizosphaerae TaxID=2735553 RepID=UPI0015EF20C6|nr:c-type cytochrome [Chthonobacter rhizosphaerae]